MRHYVQYHDPSVMGHGVGDAKVDPFEVYTSKAWGNPIGDIVWLIGRQRADDPAYFLHSWFAVEEVVGSRVPGFLYLYRGHEGGHFQPMPEVQHTTWFPRLLRITGHFKFGLTPLEVEIVSALKQLAEMAGCPVT